MRLRGWLSALLLLSGTFGVQAAPLLVPPPTKSGSALPVLKVVVFGQDARRGPQSFAEEHGLDAAEVVRDHTASGLIQCGNAHGAGQLTLADDVVTTAAHVFYDENGMPRSPSCSFAVSLNGRDVRMPIDLASIVAGSTNPYNVAPADDWAVARLVRPMAGIRPYGLAAAVHGDEPITFVARGHIDWGGAKTLSMQDCLLHDQLSAGEAGTREFSFDCDTGDGASGGALMVDRDYSRIGAILVGWRSNHPFSPVPFSRTHYNFAVTLEGAFRQAVYAAAGKMIVQR
jgi:hypothetical protein